MFEDKVTAMNSEIEAIPVVPQFEKRVYTIDEIQDILGVSKTTAYNLANSGEFRCVRVGGQYRISKKSFDKWLDALDDSTDECQVCE
jgi:excisionase family DNA binding protein